MRQTFSQLIQSTKDACIDDTTTTYTGLSDAGTFLKQQINLTVAHLFSLLRDYKLIPPSYTESTVVNQTYYNFRPGFNKLESLTVALGTHTPRLRIIQSQQEWDYLQQVPVAAGFPTAVFPRRDDYGIYPKPQKVYTMTLTGIFNPVNMVNIDVTDGTIAITNNNTAIVGTSTVFTSAMINRWLAVTTGGIPSQNFYRIASRSSNTSIAVDRKVIESTASGLSYLIGESPEIPDELHEYIPYRAAANYYMLRRKDKDQAQSLLNYFYTGDYANTTRKGNIKSGVLSVLRDLQEKGRGNSQIVETAGGTRAPNYIADGIWGLTLTAP